MEYAIISRDSEKLLMVLSVESPFLASAVNTLSDLESLVRFLRGLLKSTGYLDSGQCFCTQRNS